MSTLKVILMHDLKGKGKFGEVVSVKGGYARNYLMPRGLAIFSSQKNLKKFDNIRQEAESKSITMRQDAEIYAEKLKDIVLIVSRLAGDDGKIFGSVQSTDIVKLLKSYGINISKSDVVFKEKIKNLGNYVIDLNLNNSLLSSVKIDVRVPNREDNTQLINDERGPLKDVERFENEGGSAETYDRDGWGSDSWEQ